MCVADEQPRHLETHIQLSRYTSSDLGLTWKCTTDGTPNFDDKDDVNVFWAPSPIPRFVDMQITKQSWQLPFCDNLDGAIVLLLFVPPPATLACKCCFQWA